MLRAAAGVVEQPQVVGGKTWSFSQSRQGSGRAGYGSGWWKAIGIRSSSWEWLFKGSNGTRTGSGYQSAYGRTTQGVSALRGAQGDVSTRMVSLKGVRA
ncbi:eukaryotic translation initiation factor 3 subunit c-like protein [Sesbania bispinosa]|nr:eukaryotic translation initiation factor 3 subunit c-like protein [Sesbania bispinosa]